MGGSSKESSSEDLTMPSTPTNSTQPTSAATSVDLTTPPRAHTDASSIDSTQHTPGKIFVGGLSWETTDEGLRKYFSKYGEVSDSVVMRDSTTSRSRGFGFVTFTTVASTDAVLAETHVLDGKTIDPKLAVPREFKPSPLGSDFRTKKLFVGGLSPNTTEDSLRKYFEQFGPVAEALLMTDRETSRPRGFGFVTFDTEDAAELACAQKFHEIDHKANVEVKKAEPKSTRTRGDSRTPSSRPRAAQTPSQEYAYFPQQAATPPYAGYSGASPGYAGYGGPYMGAAYPYATASPSGRSGYGASGRPYGASYGYMAGGYPAQARPNGQAYAAVYDEYYTADMSPERTPYQYAASYPPLASGGYGPPPMGYATPRPQRGYQVHANRT